MSVPPVVWRICFCLRQLSRILRLRRLRFTALLNIFFGTDTIILLVSEPVFVIYRNLSPGTFPCFPLARSWPMVVLPQSLSFLGRVLGVCESNFSSLTDISQVPLLLKEPLLSELKFQSKDRHPALQEPQSCRMTQISDSPAWNQSSFHRETSRQPDWRKPQGHASVFSRL